MIKWVRLDERMIHGQVATKWSRTLGVDRIVVADDTAAASDIMQKSLMMAAPATCKTAIVTVDKAVSLCNDPRAAGLKILLIVSGTDKADILYQSLCGPITPHVPASILQLHNDVTVVADEAALAKFAK